MAKNPPSMEELAASPPDESVDPALAKRIEKKRTELAKLRLQKEEELIDAEMERLKNGGKGPKLVALEKDLARLRDETEKVTEGNKVFALYKAPKRSYLDPTGHNGPPRLNAEDSIVRRSIEELPDMDWLPVKKSAVVLEQQYEAR